MITLSDHSPVQLAAKPLGRGGEGEVFEILAPPKLRNRVAKIFYENKRTPEGEQKLRHLIANPPQIEENGHVFLIWPLDLLYENGSFTGFIMPRAEGIELELLCDDDFLHYPEYKGTVWEKFAFAQPDSPISRLKIAYNICAAVAAVHSGKDYVLADLKPVNIKITDKGLIAVIDLDSIQVAENGRILFASKVATPEYSPPEVSQNPKTKAESWDRFSLAVILYRILVGIHPFSGSLKPPHDKITVYEDLIKNGFYPHGKHKNKFAVINDAHNRLFVYPDIVAETFKKAFDTCLFRPAGRPSAVDWCHVLTARPEILKFEAEKSFVLPNEAVRLRWQVKNATNIEIDNGVGDVSGLKRVDKMIGGPTRFTLIASNPFGRVISQPVEVATLNLRVPDTVFVPAPTFSLQARFPIVKGINQLPSTNFPAFRTPVIHLNPPLAGKIKGDFQLSAGAAPGLVQRLKDNYEWTNNLLENSGYQLNFDDFVLYKIYSLVRQLRTFLKACLK